ncbi:MAG: phosphoenolpyruvate hydrolase family protein [Alphaproteobacteria bacterium]|nr:phosphoenolpyruvate hydrolase family protein [Alphaproteobacteria bacterium]
MARFTRDEIAGRLKAVRDEDGVLFDAFCGSGITAKMAARGGADMVTTHILAFFRMQGLSSMAGYLPIGDANAITLEIGERYLANVVPDCPVMAGILCGDPTRDMRRFVHTLADSGFDGIMNCPTVALIDGQYRKDLEETGLGYSHEVDILGYASSQGIFTKAFTTTPDEALAMAEAGVDNIIVHFGNSSGGSIGSETVMGLDGMVERTVAICEALESRFSDRLITVHGGSIETPDDFAALLHRVPRLDGYIGGSSAERFPIEDSVPQAVAAFKAVRRG